jgi:thioesterase domain-containing protein
MFRGRITAILAERTSKSGVSPKLDDRLAIGRYATEGLEVHRVKGSHLSMLEPPEVDELAAILRDCIARATAST